MGDKHKKIDGYPDYDIYSDGRVFSRKTNRFLTLSKDSSGYLSVEISKGTGASRRRVLVHRLVAQAFLKNPNNYPVVNHKDETRTNNNVENLEWCTYAYNVNYGTAPARRIAHTDFTKEIYKINARKYGAITSKKVIQLTKENVFVSEYKSIHEAGRRTKINMQHIGECAHGKRKSAGGYRW